MRLPEASLDSFPEEFVEGAVARAARVGDTGASAPDYLDWRARRATTCTRWCFSSRRASAIVEDVSGRLREQLPRDGAFVEISMQDGRALPGNVAHFGYRDGFAQPTIDGGLPPLVPDVLPSRAGRRVPVRLPEPVRRLHLSDPGTAGPARDQRKLSSPTACSNRTATASSVFLTRLRATTGLDVELIAAKLCGRWRNGVPLSLSPDTQNADLPPERYNSFDYAPTDAVPDAVDDRRGARCPIGAHIRRMNPRHSNVAGNSGLKRRLVRRGLPYGPPYNPERRTMASPAGCWAFSSASASRINSSS